MNVEERNFFLEEFHTAFHTWRESQLISASTSLHVSGDFVKQFFFGTNIYNYIPNRHVCFVPVIILRPCTREGGAGEGVFPLKE